MSRLRATHIETYLFRRRSRPMLLMLRRAAGDSLPGIWQPVTGRIRRGETALRAAAREVREEAGLTPCRWWKLEQVVTYLHPASDEMRVVPLFAAEVDRDVKPRLSREHDAFRWVTIPAAARLVLWDTQRAALAALRRQILGTARLASALEIRPPHAPARRPHAGGSRGARG